MGIPDHELMREFTLRYDGPALAEGRIAVRDLAPSLLAMADLLRDAQAEVAPDTPPVSLEIKATDQGSFEALLHLATSEIVTVTSQPAWQTAALVLGVVVDSSKGLFAVWRWLRGRRIAKRARTEPGVTRIETADGDTLEVSDGVSVLLERQGVMENMRIVVQPLKEKGVDRLFIHRPWVDEPPLKITEADASAFEVTAGEPVVDHESEVLLTVDAPSFTGGKWRVSDGMRSFWADFKDDAFVRRVNERQDLFGKDDTLRARVRFRQWEGAQPGEIKAEWTIVQVLEHRQGGQLDPDQGQVSLASNSE